MTYQLFWEDFPLILDRLFLHPLCPEPSMQKILRQVCSVVQHQEDKDSNQVLQGLKEFPLD